MIQTEDELLKAIMTYGFLPLFQNDIPGFSVEEMTDPSVWFMEGVPGPWEWKGPLAASQQVVYGKFFHRKSGFISRAWFADWLNVRRDGYDLDARFDDHLASYRDLEIGQLILDREYLLSTTLKRLVATPKGLDTVLTRLQMETYVIIADFVYAYNRAGEPYGWGTALYSSPEVHLGRDFVEKAYQSTVASSRERILDHLAGMLPQATKQQLSQWIG